MKYGIEVELKEDSTNQRGNNFLTVMETVSRMGIANTENRVLTQTCHIFHKRGKYYVMHFKEFFEMDHKAVEYDTVDMERRDCIALTLERWGLLDIVNKPDITRNMSELSIHVVKHADRSDWTFNKKYTVGNKKGNFYV